MIELRNDALHLSFPEVHPRAELRVDFQRTLRIPDDGTDHRRGAAYYAPDREALEGSEALAEVKSVLEIGEEKDEPALPENESAEPTNVVRLREGLREDQVREGRF